MPSPSELEQRLKPMNEFHAYTTKDVVEPKQTDSRPLIYYTALG